MRVTGLGLGLGLALWATAALAQEDMRAAFDVHLLGVKVGELHLTASQSDSAYATRSRFFTTGVAGAMKRVRFDLAAKGQRRGQRYSPTSYDEEIDTGRRASSARLRYRGGVPHLIGGAAGEGPTLDPAQQKGTIDPLTALFAALHDQPAGTLCQLKTDIFDGARRSRITLTGRRDTGTGTTCTGEYRRIAGYSAREMAERSRFPVSIDYAPTGTVMRATAARVKSIYGNVVMHRR